MDYSSRPTPFSKLSCITLSFLVSLKVSACCITLRIPDSLSSHFTELRVSKYKRLSCHVIPISFPIAIKCNNTRSSNHVLSWYDVSFPSNYSSFFPGTNSGSLPKSILSTFSFFPCNPKSNPQTGVNNGTNIPTRCWYAPYPCGYFDFDMLSVKSVEDRNNVHRTTAGVSGQYAEILSKLNGGRLGFSGANNGNRVMMIY